MQSKLFSGTLSLHGTAAAGLLLFAGCNRPSATDVPGRYARTGDFFDEALILSPDGRFSQNLSQGGKVVDGSDGHWEFLHRAVILKGYVVYGRDEKIRATSTPKDVSFEFSRTGLYREDEGGIVLTRTP
jgi:hypothetical protein